MIWVFNTEYNYKNIFLFTENKEKHWSSCAFDAIINLNLLSKESAINYWKKKWCSFFLKLLSLTIDGVYMKSSFRSYSNNNIKKQKDEVY